MASARCRDYYHRVKHKKISRGQNPKAAAASRPATAESSQKEIDFATVTDAAAKKSYFSHANHGSSQGHEVQHWLEAEAQLLAERKLHRAKFLLSVPT
jgi:hypothetical protein